MHFGGLALSNGIPHHAEYPSMGILALKKCARVVDKHMRTFDSVFSHAFTSRLAVSVC
jgi:hypothetical protein